MKTKEIISDVFYIYGLFDNVDAIKYIGITKNPYRRDKEHYRFSSNKKLRTLVNEFNIFKMKIIAEFYDNDLAIEYEKFLIYKYKDKILNVVLC